MYGASPDSKGFPKSTRSTADLNPAVERLTKRLAKGAGIVFAGVALVNSFVSFIKFKDPGLEKLCVTSLTFTELRSCLAIVPGARWRRDFAVPGTTSLLQIVPHRLGGWYLPVRPHGCHEHGSHGITYSSSPLDTGYNRRWKHSAERA
mgnify:CR=1 FL=1